LSVVILGEEVYMFITKLREYSIPLIAGVVIALIWANVDHHSYEFIVEHPIFKDTILGDISLHFLINDIFMVFFFAIAGIEIVHSLSPGGALNPINKAVTPLLATVGGVVGPAGLFLILNATIAGGEFTPGWGVCTATDIALAWLLARLVFGHKHPAVSFLLLLAVADDGIGLAIIAIFYPDPDKPAQYAFLLLVVLAMVLAFIFKKLGIHHWGIYVLVCGTLSWVGMHSAGLHPALAMVFIVPFLPRDIKHPLDDTKDELWDVHGEDTPIRKKDVLHRMETHLAPVVDFGLILFGITNAGVEFSNVNTLTWMVMGSLIVGKTLGVTLFTFASVKLRLSTLPEGMSMKETIVAGMVAGMGLTVALFVAGVAFNANLELGAAAKMGALFTAAVFIIAPIAGKLMKIKKINE
jgi:NhaA family Na+:H+ antiporter